jgi:hypothetical protein
MCANGKILYKFTQKTGCENADLVYLTEDRVTASCGYHNQEGAEFPDQMGHSFSTVTFSV